MHYSSFNAYSLFNCIFNEGSEGSDGAGDFKVKHRSGCGGSYHVITNLLLIETSVAPVYSMHKKSNDGALSVSSQQVNRYLGQFSECMPRHIYWSCTWIILYTVSLQATIN